MKMVSVRFINIQQKEAAESILYDGRDQKLRLVSRLYDGKQAQEGEKPLAFWLRCIAEENGLPVQTPAVPEIASVVGSEPALNRFVWFLA